MSGATKTWRYASATTTTVPAPSGTGTGAGTGTSTGAVQEAVACACDVGPFAITSGGALTATAALDHEALGAYTVPVTVSDGSGKATTGSVAVYVTNVVEAPVLRRGQVRP